MSQPYLGEIINVGFGFAPRGWALCDGQLLSINANQALYSLLGTNYGGDGRTTFALPDMRGRMPLHAGIGPGLNYRSLASRGGVENQVLTINQMPSHKHDLQASTNNFSSNVATSSQLATAEFDAYAEDLSAETLANTSIDNAGSNQAHTNEMPTLGIYYIIALQGIFPSRS